MGVKEFLDSWRKIQIEEGANDEDGALYLPAVLKDRSEKYSKRMMEKYPLSLQQKAFDYFNSLSPLEQAEFAEHMEDVLQEAIEADPTAFTADEIRALFKEDGHRKPLTPGVYDTPIRTVDRTKWENENVLVEVSEKPVVKEVKIPSEEEARTMDLKKLRKFIPHAGIDDEE